MRRLHFEYTMQQSVRWVISRLHYFKVYGAAWAITFSFSTGSCTMILVGTGYGRWRISSRAARHRLFHSLPPYATSAPTFFAKAIIFAFHYIARYPRALVADDFLIIFNAAKLAVIALLTTPTGIFRLLAPAAGRQFLSLRIARSMPRCTFSR